MLQGRSCVHVFPLATLAPRGAERCFLPTRLLFVWRGISLETCEAFHLPPPNPPDRKGSLMDRFHSFLSDAHSPLSSIRGHPSRPVLV